jgi:hypothetical protein
LIYLYKQSHSRHESHVRSYIIIIIVNVISRTDNIIRYSTRFYHSFTWLFFKINKFSVIHSLPFICLEYVDIYTNKYISIYIMCTALKLKKNWIFIHYWYKFIRKKDIEIRWHRGSGGKWLLSSFSLDPDLCLPQPPV